MTNPTPDHRSLPRKKRPPTSRDQAIFLAYRTAGFTQAQLAKDHRLSQRRISEIIQHVERWRADLIPAAAGKLDDRQQHRLERWIEQQRLQSIYDRAIRGYDTQSRELKTTRQGDRDGKPYRDETTRELPQNVQLLKVALRAAEDLGKLCDKPAPAAPDPHSAHQRYWKAHALIRELRRDNGVTEDDSLWSNESAIIAQALDHLIGKESASDREPESSPALQPRGVGVSPALPTRSVSEGQAEDVNVGCISAAQCTISGDDDTTGDDSEPETYSLQPETQNPPSDVEDSSNRSNPSPPLPAQSPAASTSATAGPATTLDFGPRTLDLDPNSPAERRRRHQEKLDQLYEARRRGFPCLIEFDPADGPLPLTYYHLDGVGH